jgi:hypothetical protein
MFLPTGVLSPKLLSVLVPRITSQRAEDYLEDNWVMLNTGSPELSRLGVVTTGEFVSFAFKSIDYPLGNVKIHASQPGSVIIFDNWNWKGALSFNARLQGAGGTVVLNLSGPGSIQLGNVYLRSTDQLLFWGVGSTSVNCRAIEIEGKSRLVAVGDDAMLASGVSIRNHDMHAIIDSESMAVMNTPKDTILEQHVWLGQDALLICERIGFGTVVGARSFVKGSLPPMVLAAGTPSRVLQEKRTWGRDVAGLNDQERRTLTRLL